MIFPVSARKLGAVVVLGISGFGVWLMVRFPLPPVAISPEPQPIPLVTTISTANPTLYACAMVDRYFADLSIGYSNGTRIKGWYISHDHTRMSTPVDDLRSVELAYDAITNPQLFATLPGSAMSIYCDASRHLSGAR